MVTPTTETVIEERIVAPAAIPGGGADPTSLYRRPVSQIFRGTESFVGASSLPRVAEAIVGEGGITLNFVNADVRDVIKAVLGDFLRLNYTIDPNVQGFVTIQTSSPLGEASVLPVLEQALNLNGVAIIPAGEVYKIVPLGSAPRLSGLSVAEVSRAAAQPGYGVEIVPLQYISASEMRRLLEPIAPPGAIVNIDPARNLLIIGGTERERGALLSNIGLFDVDWLAGMSFALFSPRSVRAEVLARELEEIIGGEGGPLADVVRLIPIERLNAVLAISPQARYLERLRTWVERLDQPGETIDRRFFVYHVQNGRAKDLAAVLSEVMGSSRNTSATPTIPGVPSIVDRSLPLPTGPSMEEGLPDPFLYEEEVPYVIGDRGVSFSGLDSVNITADETNNALLILATPREYEIIEAAIRQLDIVPLQVLLEAAIAEVTLTNELRYGVQYFFEIGSSDIILSGSDTSIIAPTFPGFGAVISAGSNIKIILDALDSVTTVNVISSPEVLVLNNQTATLQVGDQVPVATQQAVGVQDPDAPIVNSIEFRDTGVILSVTPRVNRGGMVQMDISQEVSDVVPTTTSTLNSPTIQQRKIISSVAVYDGETIALGGLIRDRETDGRSGIPLLMDIPVVGNLFSMTEKVKRRTELLILITPHVVESLEKARAVTEELRRKLPATQIFFTK